MHEMRGVAEGAESLERLESGNDLFLDARTCQLYFPTFCESVRDQPTDRRIHAPIDMRGRI